MFARAWALAMVLPVLIPAAAGAQEYGTHQPVIKTTSAPTLRAAAVQREVHERFAIGLAAQSRRDWNKAAPEFERILQLTNAQPQHSTAAYDLAIVYAEQKRLSDSARMLRTAIAGDPEFLAAYANIVAVDLARGDVGEARSYADTFVKLAPDSARALYSRGLTALRQKDPRTAAADFGKLLQDDPSYAVAHYDLGIAESSQNHLAEAEREFQTAVSLAPQYARARFALATVLLKRGKRAEARVALDATVRDAVADPALLNLAVALRDAMK